MRHRNRPPARSIFTERLAGLDVTPPWNESRLSTPGECPACGGRSWWSLRGSAHRVCVRCHPSLDPEGAVFHPEALQGL